MHKIKKYIAEDLKFSNQTIKEMKINSKKFYNNIKAVSYTHLRAHETV